jgi:HJR/Mrr/RecB family endonuclease
MKRLMVNVLVDQIETKRFSIIMDTSMTKVASIIDRETRDYKNVTTDNHSISIVEYLGSRKDFFISDSLLSGFVKYSTGLITAMFDIKNEENEKDFDIEILSKCIRDQIFKVFMTVHEINVVEVFINEVPLKPYEKLFEETK